MRAFHTGMSGFRIVGAGCQVAANPDEHTQHRHYQPKPLPHEPCCQPDPEQVENRELHLEPREVIHHADNHQNPQTCQNQEGLRALPKSFEPSNHAETLVYAPAP